jgi:hypothetical protein
MPLPWLLAVTKNAGVRSVSSWFAVIVSPVLRPLMAWVAGLVLCGLTACRDAEGPSGVGGFEVVRLTRRCQEGPVTKSGREVMEIFEAFDTLGPSRGCGSSGTGARARASAGAGRSCSAGGWPGPVISAFGAKVHALTVIEDGTRHIRVPGATASPPCSTQCSRPLASGDPLRRGAAG